MTSDFTYLGSKTIPLTADLVTGGILVSNINSVQIQFLDITGLNGTPTYTLESSLDKITFIPYDGSYTSGVDINNGLRITSFQAQYIRLNILVNDNTTGSCTIKLIGR